ncbi:MAG: pyridoxamine 5'-phosphate oxidase [Bacteroidota bacterium]|nr:pyridoxamine 5'-phosphate oxidase [Bacteroidota bacterium]
MDLKNMRISYQKSKIDFENLDENPIDFFKKWFNEAVSINKYEANACVLSTVSIDNKPTSRVVLLKDFGDKFFTFFTNYKSGKSFDILNNKHVALNFSWPELERQVRISGEANKIDAKDSDDYFKTRPRESQIGAWLSDQSTSIDLNYNVSDLLNELEIKFKDKQVDRPLHWGGYSIDANRIEFWQGRPLRFHDRLVYEFNGKTWHKKRLAP